MTYPMIAITSQRATSRKPTMESTSQTISMTSYEIKDNLVRKKKTSKEPKEKITYDNKSTDNLGEFLKSATKNDIGLNNQLQIVEETLEESNDFPKEGDDETVIDFFGTTFNFASSV